MPKISLDQLLKEKQKFVVQGIIYKVIRMRPNGKATIKPIGVWTPPEPETPKELTPKEKKEEQEFFQEEENDAKSNEERPAQGTGNSKESRNGTGQESSRPGVAGGSPAKPQ